MTWQFQPDFNPGYIPRGPDSRDIPFRAVAKITTPIDWSHKPDWNLHNLFKRQDQGGSSSCVGQAWRTTKARIDHKDTGRIDDLSAEFIYSRIRQPDGGAYGYKGGSILLNLGTPLQAFCSDYENGNPPSEEFMSHIIATPGALQSAEIRKIKAYASVDPDIDQFAMAIRENIAIPFGVNGTNAGWQTGYVRPPQSGEGPVWGHFLCAIDYTIINGKRAIVFENSWSDRWGDRGFGYITEDYFAARTVYPGFTITDIPNALLEQTHMKRRIMLENTVDQYTVDNGKKKLIPDAETLADLAEAGIIAAGDPDIVSKTEFDGFVTLQPWASVLVNNLARQFYSGVKGSMELNQ